MGTNRKKSRSRKVIYTLALIPLIIILVLFGWVFAVIFEGERPIIKVQPMPEFLTEGQKFTLQLRDTKRGLKKVEGYLSQEGREITVYEEKFPFKGLLNREGVRQYEKEINVDPSRLNLAQGRVDLSVRVWDYSKRGGGDGNMSVALHTMNVDTIPPATRAISRMHNINRGGTCLVLYQTSSDTAESGVYIDGNLFPGFPADNGSQKGANLCYFALPVDSGRDPSIYLWAKDKAANHSRTTFYNHIRSPRFRKERVNITDKFLERVLPYFSFFPLAPEDSDVEKYIKINNDLRRQSHRVFLKLKEKTSPERMWEGPFLRQKNAATMSQFGERRYYYYMGKKIDEQIHLGVDLASLANSPVAAANHGRVLFAERNGIYGLTVVLDHGQGLASLYAHLSKIEVTQGRYVKKGDVIGFTGRTGLAGGDHLHFAILVNGIFVNPIEWWDPHWIRDNIEKKLAFLEK